MSKAVAVREETAAAPDQSPADIMAVIGLAARDPNVDVEKMERLFALKAQLDKDQKEAAYMAALSRVQPKIPQISKNGRILVNDQVRSRFARLEDIDSQIRPIIAEEGFAISFDTEMVGDRIKISGRLSHREGHSEAKTLFLPIDNSGGKNGVQAVGSTVSYGRRMLLKMFFNIIEAGEDTDGNPPISAEQEQTLDSLITDVGVDRGRFLNWLGVSKLSELSRKRYDAAVRKLEEKRK